MKIRSHAPSGQEDEWVRLSEDADVQDEAKAKAARLGVTFSDYLSGLISSDVASGGAQRSHLRPGRSGSTS